MSGGRQVRVLQGLASLTEDRVAIRGRLVDVAEEMASVAVVRLGREWFAEWEPRKRPESMMQSTAGRTNSPKGKSWAGREWRDYLEYVHNPEARFPIRNVSVWAHSIPLGGGVVDVMAADGYPPRAGAFLELVDGGWEGKVVAAHGAMFEWLTWVVSRFPVRCAAAGWQLGSHQEYLSATVERFPAGDAPLVLGYRSMMWLPPSAVAVLGGLGRVRKQAPVERIEKVVGSDGRANGLVVSVVDDPRQLSVDRVEQWREYLSVVSIPIRSLWDSGRYPDGREPEDRPVDILAEDWPGPVGSCDDLLSIEP